MSLINGLPRRILYCIISPSITCNTVYTIFDPTVMGKEIDSTIGQRASLNDFNCKEGTLIYEKGMFKFLNAIIEIIFIDDPSSINIILNIFPSTLVTTCNVDLTLMPLSNLLLHDHKKVIVGF